MIKQNNIKFYIILLLLILNFFFFDNFSLNENIPEFDIIKLIEKFFNTDNTPIVTEQEKIIAEYWKMKSNSDPTQCPFSTLISHNLTTDEANFLIDFFKIETVADLEKLKKYLL